MTETATPWYETISMPALLRHARTTYGAAMRGALADAGFTVEKRPGFADKRQMLVGRAIA